MNITRSSSPIATHRWTLPIIKSETLPAMHNLKEAEADVEHTACSSTLRSRSSSLLSGVVGSNSKLGSFRSSINNVSASSCPQDQGQNNTTRNNNNRAPSKKRLSHLFSTMKLRTRRWSRRRTTISEPKLRKKLKKFAERGDWSSVKKLLSNHDFADIPIPEHSRENSTHELKSSSGGSDKRRPSYGSRNSFTGKESAAAAAAIKAAQFDEGSSAALSSEIQDVGENVLHDICRCSPPLDVIESLLWSLRHRRGYTTGRDEMGRTPLHVAASYGSSPDVVDALARADPSPASIADVDGRTPLHIAVMYLAYNGNVDNFPPLVNQGVPPSIRDGEPLDEDAHEQLATTILILKTVMTTYPGVVDFKDDDKLGYSPLDYAIDGNITDEHLLHGLLRRKGLTPQRRYSGASNNTQGTSNTTNLYRPLRRRPRPDCDSSSVRSTGSQDISILLRLEEDEIAVHREKVEKLRLARRKVKIQSTLFDMFGIDQEDDDEPVARVHEMEMEQKEAENTAATKLQQSENVDQVMDTNDTEKPKRSTSRRMLARKSFRSNFTSSSSRRLRDSDVQNSMGSADIYNAHLDAYLNGLVNEDLEVRDDDDSFDIFHDPEEDVEVPQEEPLELYDAELENSQPPLFEIDIQLGVMDATLNDDCSQCSFFGSSVISEVSVPAVLISRES